MGVDRIVDSHNCLDNRLGRVEMRIENLHVDWLQSAASSAQTLSIDNEAKIKELERRLSTVEAKLRMAEETIEALQRAASKAKADVGKPSPNKPKP